jgi:hypothetical protein
MEQQPVVALDPRIPASLMGRLLRPSFSDLFFLSLLSWLFLSSPDGFSSLLLDGDTGWHIRTGDYILSTGQIPRTDLFSFSKAGQTWFAWEWGADVIYSLLHRVWGLKGIAWLGGVQIVLFATILFRYTLWRGANTMWALLVGLLAVGASTVHYLARPHLFTLLLLPVCIWMLEADRRSPRWFIWLTIPITAVWTNLHGGVLAWVACAGIFAAGRAVEAWLEPERRNWPLVIRHFMLLAGTAAATLANPYGWNLHLHVAAYLRSDFIREMIQEFQAPTFRNENQLQYEALLLVGLMAAAVALSRRRVVEGLLILFWAHQSLGSIRHITVFSTIASPIIAEEATLLWRWWVARAGRKSTRSILDALAADMRPSFAWTSVWPAAGALALLLVSSLPVQWPQDFPEFRFPVKLVQKHEPRLRSARLLTTDQWADYLIYRFYPTQRVYFDGRSDFYGADLGREYMRVSGGAHDWRQILERHRFDHALVPLGWSLTSLLKEDKTWRLVEDDGKTLLFERITAQLPVAAKAAQNLSVPALMN